MTIKQNGGIFGRNPTFNDVEADGTLTVTGQSTFNSNITVQNDVNPKISILDSNGGFNAASFLVENGGRDLAIFAQQDIIIDSNSGELARFLKDGGLTFNGDTANSNALDDYEEGTWTPDPQDSSGNSGSAGTASGYYTKIGNVVFATVLLENINTSGLTSGQDFRIYGLPYTSASLVGSQIFTGAARMNNVTFSGNPNLAILDNTDYIRIVESISGSASDFVVVSEITSGTADIYGTITYMAA